MLMPTRIRLIIPLLLCLPLPSLSAAETDYQQELQQIDLKLHGNNETHPLFHLQQAYYQFQRTSLTATARDYSRSSEQLDNLTTANPGRAAPAVQLLVASLQIKLHNLKAAGEALQGIPPSPQKTLLLADIDLQNGAWPKARKKLQSLPAAARQQWDFQARMARIAWQTGHPDKALGLYEKAAARLTGQQMRDYAWVMLQAGKLQLEQNQPEQAWQYYQRADTAYSGYWMVAKHKAEWLTVQERAAEAITIYRQLLEGEPNRPELSQALGELYYKTADPLAASYWLEQARQGYQASVSHGEIHYLHHYTELLSEFLEAPEEAIRWGVKDLAHRQSPHSWDALGWAYYRAGRMEEARQAIKHALEIPRPDAEIRYHARAIFDHPAETERENTAMLATVKQRKDK